MGDYEPSDGGSASEGGGGAAAPRSRRSGPKKKKEAARATGKKPVKTKKAAGRRGRRAKSAEPAAAEPASETKAALVLDAIESKYSKKEAEREALEVITARIRRSLYLSIRGKADTLGISMNQLLTDVLELTFPTS